MAEKKISEIDIEQIMSEIRNNIKERGYTDKELTFAKFADDYKRVNCAGELPNVYDAEQFNANLERLDCSREIIPWKVLHGNKLKVFIQKVIRKAIRFYVDPVVEEQNRNNYLIANLISQLDAKTIDGDEVEALKDKVRELEIEISELKAKLGEKTCE